MGLEWSDLNPATWPGQVKSRLEKDFGEKPEDKKKRANLEQQAKYSSVFADEGQHNYGAMTRELDKQRQFYGDMLAGRNSVSTEQLRQGLLQQQAAQQSMAAGASPQNQAMAARNAMMNVGRAQSNMAGQAALAQLQERQMAADQLAKINLGQRGQDVNVGLGSRQNAISGYGGTPPGAPSVMQQLAAAGGTAAGLFSDRRLKTDVQSGDSVARRALESLSAKTFRYKDPKHGTGERLGVLAQDLQSAGLGQTVKRTREGLTLDPGELSATNTAMLAALARRMTKLEREAK